MDNDSTRNDGLLSLAERARLGLLLLEPALRLDDIAELECPERRYGPKAEAWIKRLEAACKWGDLQLEPGEIYDPFGGWPYISRENYRTWRATQHNLPADSQITKWLGATPAVEALPPVEPSLPELPVLAVLPETVATGGAAKKTREIALVDAENSALLTLRKELKREPDLDEFWDYLTTRDATGTVADSTNERLDWIGRSGKSCSTKKATVRNRLTTAKNRNPFTPV